MDIRKKTVLLIALILHSVAGVCAEPPTVSLPGDRVFPESITSTTDGTLYVGSLVAGGVYRIEANSKTAQLWIKPGEFGSRSIFGVLADEASGLLWVCSNDLSIVGIAGPSSEAGSSLKGFDLKSGAGRISVPLPGPHAICNDIAVGPDGSVFVTNTTAPQILRLPKAGKALQVWMSEATLQPANGGGGLDGIAFGSDGNLYVDTYTPGELYRVDVAGGKAGKVTKLSTSRALVLPDAIRPIGKNAFLMVEGGGSLDRVVIQGDSASVETIRDGFSTPTGVAVAGKKAWVSEGQLTYVFDPSKKGQTPVLPFRIYAAPLAAEKENR